MRCSSRRMTAFRAGNFGASNATLQLLKDLRFKLDSSFNPFHLGRDCDLRFTAPPNDVFLDASGIWELPVSNVLQPGDTLRHLEVTALSQSEMRWALDKLSAMGARHITILTHPDEFFVIDSVDPLRGRPNTITSDVFGLSWTFWNTTKIALK